MGIIQNSPFNTYNPLIAMLRFVKWQIKKRFSGDNLSFEWVNSLQISTSKNDNAFALCHYTGLSEFEDQAFLIHFLRKDDLFVDIGANSGVYSILASGISKAKSISIEPIPGTFLLLKNNVSTTNFSENITLLNCGLGSSGGSLKFTDSLGAGNHVIMGNYNNFEPYFK